MLGLTTHIEGKMVGMSTAIAPFLIDASDASEATVSQSQYERTVRLARLAMLIECEGSITIGMSPPTKTRNRPSLYPTVDLTNTAQQIIDEAKDTLISEGIGFSTKPERYSSGFGRKLRNDINIHAFDRVEAVLLAIMPYLRSKKAQAEIVLEFIRLRRSAESKSAYSDREWELTTLVRKLNGRSPSIRAIEKAKTYLESYEGPNRPRTAEYYRKYVEMCTELQNELSKRG